MNSEGWRKLIDDIAATIREKELRLEAIAHEKAAAITEPTKLLLLEVEESELPTAIAQLRKRMPIIDGELETALRAEAELRLGELAQQGAEAAVLVSESTQTIREAMEALLARVSEAHEAWAACRLLAAEAEFLHVRFSLPSLQIPPEKRIGPEERHNFVREFALRLHRPANSQPWESLRRDFQDAQRRTESQQREDEFKERSTGPHYQPIRTVRHAESR